MESTTTTTMTTTTTRTRISHGLKELLVAAVAFVFVQECVELVEQFIFDLNT